MTIEFNCPNCQKLLRTADEKAGASAKCPGCGERVWVPHASEESPPPPPPSGEAEADADDAIAYDALGADEQFAAESPAEATVATKPCPMCGEMIQSAAVKCRFCGENLSGFESVQPAAYMRPHRGTLILVFGILSWFVCIIFGIVAWVMANEDLRAMEAGTMDPSGEGMTRAGKIIAIVQICLAGAFILFYCVFFMIMMMAGAAGNF